MWTDDGLDLDAIHNSSKWPRYRSLTGMIHRLIVGFKHCGLKISSTKASRVARRIAKRMTKNMCFQPYVTTGGPTWLQASIEEERLS